MLTASIPNPKSYYWPRICKLEHVRSIKFFPIRWQLSWQETIRQVICLFSYWILLGGDGDWIWSLHCWRSDALSSWAIQLYTVVARIPWSCHLHLGVFSKKQLCVQIPLSHLPNDVIDHVFARPQNRKMFADISTSNQLQQHAILNTWELSNCSKFSMDFWFTKHVGLNNMLYFYFYLVYWPRWR